MASTLISVCEPTTPSAEADMRPRSRTKLDAPNGTQQKEERRDDEQERESTHSKEQCTDERKCTETSESGQERDEVHTKKRQREPDEDDEVHAKKRQREPEEDDEEAEDDDDALFRCDEDYATVEMIGLGAYGSVYTHLPLYLTLTFLITNAIFMFVDVFVVTAELIFFFFVIISCTSFSLC